MNQAQLDLLEHIAVVAAQQVEADACNCTIEPMQDRGRWTSWIQERFQSKGFYALAAQCSSSRLSELSRLLAIEYLWGPAAMKFPLFAHPDFLAELDQLDYYRAIVIYRHTRPKR